MCAHGRAASATTRSARTMRRSSRRRPQPSGSTARSRRGARARLARSHAVAAAGLAVSGGPRLHSLPTASLQLEAASLHAPGAALLGKRSPAPWGRGFAGSAEKLTAQCARVMEPSWAVRMQVVYTLRQGRDHPDDAVFSESGAMNVMFFLDKARAAPAAPALPFYCNSSHMPAQRKPTARCCRPCPERHISSLAWLRATPSARRRAPLGGWHGVTLSRRHTRARAARRRAADGSW